MKRRSVVDARLIRSRSVATNQHPIGILGTGSTLLDQVLTNADLATRVATDPQWIQTGGITLQMLEPQAASTLLDEVARQLLVRPCAAQEHLREALRRALPRLTPGVQ